jgi:hypothetical protein
MWAHAIAVLSSFDVRSLPNCLYLHVRPFHPNVNTTTIVL